jgi:hypothetical protein
LDRLSYAKPGLEITSLLGRWVKKP